MGTGSVMDNLINPLDIDELRAILDVDEGPPIGAVFAMTSSELNGFARAHITLN